MPKPEVWFFSRQEGNDKILYMNVMNMNILLINYPSLSHDICLYYYYYFVCKIHFFFKLVVLLVHGKNYKFIFQCPLKAQKV